MDPKGGSEGKPCVSFEVSLVQKHRRLQLDKCCSNALLSCAWGMQHTLLVSLCEKVGEVGNVNFLKPSG